MEVNCEGCAGCCVDWRALSPVSVDHERRGPYVPLDGTYNLVPLWRDEVRGFLRAGLGDALVPRLWRAREGPSVTVGGVDLAAIDGRPVFFVGLRKPPKPVAPFGQESAWLPTCVFLDPATLQCRIHGDDLYPETCARYPGDNLALAVETECERVEDTWGGERLRDDTPPPDGAPLLGPAALGATVFAHPDPDRIADAVGDHADDLTRAGRETRAEFVAVAAASSPGTLAINEDAYERAREQALAADSWAGTAIEDWTARAGDTGDPAPDPAVAARVEDGRGAPPTPGWNGDDPVQSGRDASATGANPTPAGSDADN